MPAAASPLRRFTALCLVVSIALVGLFSSVSGAEESGKAPATAPSSVSIAPPALAPLAPIEYSEETLGNGLHVIYAPLRQAPVVHVRVLYHVGSRDERPDRQGFAHMFEHMMFRGSAHVAPEQHMKMIMQVGGNCNAFTMYDQTTYHETIPASNVEMALYLEADRMASFKVSDDIFKTERKVVAEEWRMRYANQPYGPLFADFVKTAFTTHPYRWTTIGDMDQLKAARSSELQEFFNKYYVPNNATLIIAGDIDQAATKKWVREYFGWIPRGPDVARDIPTEPEQTESRRIVVHKRDIPLGTVLVGFKTTGYADDDHVALDILGDILGGGTTSRLEKLLVNSTSPMCNSAGAGDFQLEDQAMFVCHAAALPGKDLDQIEKTIHEAIEEVCTNGVTQEELDKARTKARLALIQRRDTAEDIATVLGEECVFGGATGRVNTEWAKMQKLTPADIQAIARKYLQDKRMTVLQYVPDPLGLKSKVATTSASDKATEVGSADVVKSDVPVAPRPVAFPKDYPAQPPLVAPTVARPFEKGVESTTSNGVKVIVMPDHRLPLVSWSLVMRAGSDAEPKGKEGLASMTASMVRRGAGDLYFLELSDDLESRGISIQAMDAGDNTRLVGSCTSEQLDHAMKRTREVLLSPKLPEPEFLKVRFQSSAGLMQAFSNPEVVAGRELNFAVFGDTPLGRKKTIEALKSITLDDIKGWYKQVYRPNDAIFVISGDVTPQRGKELAEQLVAGWEPAASMPKADYTLADPATARKIVLVDNPDGKQSTIRMAVRAYDIHSDAKYAGSAAGRILSDGIHARFDKYVRAEKGFTYGSYGAFEPGRHGGLFTMSVDTNPDTTAPCIEAMFKVVNDVRKENVTAEELVEAKTRVAGGMVMQMQTIGQQASKRVDAILNGYPADYYDVYPKKIGAVTADEIREVMDKYVKDDRMTIVVVAPASQVKGQLETLGAVEVVPMPAKPKGGVLGQLLK